ncbi:putative 5-carboxymethyl-2-hydroxymuconate isomerase [Seiridium cardinale]
MPAWTHLVRFLAVEDDQVHLGQLVDTARDVGLDSVNGTEIKARLINGDIFNGKVTSHVYTVKKLLSPVAKDQCSFIRCLGLNYLDHAKILGFNGSEQEANLQLPAAPILFSKPRTALTDPYPAAVTIPKCAQDETSDYEAELCVVIGTSGRDIPEADALDYVLGYTSSNDISARNLQMTTTQWSFSKGLDNSCPIGPVLVSTSVIPDPQQLKIKTIYNGETLQDGHTGDMIFDIKKQIAYLSQGTTLEAGSIILTGTPAGIGFFRKPRVFLQDGSDVRVEIEKIGTLVNKIRYEPF